MIKIIDNPKIIKTLLGSIILLFLFSLVYRAPHVDDAWLGEYSYWFATTGTTKSELMRGITQHEEKLVVHHKLHTLMAAPIIKKFGFSLPALKASSLVFLFLFVWVFYRYTFPKILSKNQFLLALTLLLFNAMIFDLSFVYRPDIPMMTLGFASFVFIDRFLNTGQRTPNILFAGLLAGLATTMHLNGLMYIFAGFVLLVLNRKYTYSMLFGLSTLPTLAIYFFDMTSVSDFQLWIYQYGNSTHLGNTGHRPLMAEIFLRIADEQMRYLHSPKEISFTLLLTASLVLGFRHLKKYKNLLRYTLLLIIALSLLSIHKASYYVIAILPFFILIITLSINHIFLEKKTFHLFSKNISAKTQMQLISGILIIYLITQLVYNTPIAFTKYDSKHNHNISLRYIGSSTDTLNIVAPMKFVYNEIEHYNRIQGEICYNELKKNDSSIFQAGFLARATEFDIDYIILMDNYIGHFGLDDMTEEDIRSANFDLICRDEKMVILKKHNNTSPKIQLHKGNTISP